MSARYMPKTLAKTLDYMAFRSPGEFGLFWDADGTMPWKELYWALQEDPFLKFVRETHLKEIAFLGIEMPFALDGASLRLAPGIEVPVYPVVETPPERLFHAIRLRQYPSVSKYGLESSGRSHIRLTSDKDLAVRIARRREPDPVTIEVLAGKAHREGGVVLRAAGPSLFLVESVPVQYLRCPQLREDVLLKLSEGPRKKEKQPEKTGRPFSPGSFVVGVDSLSGSFPGQGVPDKGGKKARRGAEWKKEARKERRKRDV